MQNSSKDMLSVCLSLEHPFKLYMPLYNCINTEEIPGELSRSLSFALKHEILKRENNMLPQHLKDDRFYAY